MSRLKPFTERNPVITAIVGSVLIIATVAVVFNFQRLPVVGEGPEYSAEFRDASGLQAGEDVRIAGIKVGTISEIELEGAKVVVYFHVKNERFGENTTASIEIKTLLGQHYLSLTPAGPGELPAGAQIPIKRTHTPLNIVPAFQRLTGTTQRIDTRQVAKAFDTLSEALQGTAPEVRGTLFGLSRLSKTIASRDDQIQQLFSRARSVSGVIASRDRQVTQLINDTNSVLGLLDSRRETIHRILVGTTQLSQQLSGLVADNRDTIGPALDKLGQVVDVLQRNDAQLDKLIGQTTVYAREFTNVGGSGNWFDATVKFPRGFALCSNGTQRGLGGVLNSVLSAANKAENGASTPCMPLGPAANTDGEGGR